MKLYVMRHGDAVPGGGDIADETRWLTVEGRRSAAASAALLKRRSVAIDVIVTSPLVRAVQTAEIVGSSLGFGGERSALELLSPESDVRRTVTALEALGAASVLAVSHEPLVSNLVAVLGNVRVGFRPAQVVALEAGGVLFSVP